MNYNKTAFWLILAGGLIIAIVYGLSFLSKPEEKLFKQVAKKQKAQEIEPLLEDLKKITNGTSTASSLREAEIKKQQIEAIEKKYDKILNPESVKEPSAPRVSVEWFLEGKATADLIESYDKQRPLISRAVTSITWDKNKMSLKYIGGDGKEREIVLERDTSEQFYAGYYWNLDTRKNSVLWLKEPTDGKKNEFYDQIKREKVVRETFFTGWMSKSSRGDTMDMEMSVVKQTTTAASFH